MNLLEHYIEEIHSEQEFKYEILNDDFVALVEADVTINCYGVVERVKTTMAKDKWLKAKELGYYLA